MAISVDLHLHTCMVQRNGHDPRATHHCLYHTSNFVYIKNIPPGANIHNKNQNRHHDTRYCEKFISLQIHRAKMWRCHIACLFLRCSRVHKISGNPLQQAHPVTCSHRLKPPCIYNYSGVNGDKCMSSKKTSSASTFRRLTIVNLRRSRTYLVCVHTNFERPCALQP